MTLYWLYWRWWSDVAVGWFLALQAASRAVSGAIGYTSLGIGRSNPLPLIMDALYRSLGVSRANAAFAVVDAIDDEAVRFYPRFEFQSFSDRLERLFRTMASIAQSFASLSSGDWI